MSEPLSTRVNKTLVYISEKIRSLSSKQSNVETQVSGLETQLSALLPKVLDMVRPVGSYYWSSDPTEPGTLFGGTWERIRGKFLYAEDDDVTVGSTGGEKTHTLTVAETPEHSHTRGTMNITGSVGQGYTSDGTINGGWHNHNNKGYGTGALYLDGTSNGSSCTWLNYSDAGIIKFDASRNWTGSTSTVGGGRTQQHATIFGNLLLETYSMMEMI